MDKPAKLILLVEDQSDIRDVFAFILAEAGYEVLQAGDGEEALSLIKGRRPHAVITDLLMPNMDGLDLARAMKSAPDMSDIPIGMVTATPSRVLAQTPQFLRILSKPCSTDDLVDMAHFLVTQ